MIEKVIEVLNLNLIRVMLVLIVSVDVTLTFSKANKLQRYSLGLITLAFLIQTVQSALQHTLEETALTGMMAIVYYCVYIKASKTTLRSDYDDIDIYKINFFKVLIIYFCRVK